MRSITFILSTLLFLSLFTTSGKESYATPLDSNASDNPLQHLKINEFSWLNWFGTTYLAEDQWCNVLGENNLFNAVVTVTNHSENTGNVQINIINYKGELITNTVTVTPGSRETFAVPWNSGTFTVRANASVSGEYAFEVIGR